MKTYYLSQLHSRALLCLVALLPFCQSLCAEENYSSWFSRYRDPLPTSWDPAIHSRILVLEAKKPNTVVSLLHYARTPQVEVIKALLKENQEIKNANATVTGIHDHFASKPRTIAVFGSFTPLFEARKPFPLAGKVAFSREVSAAEAATWRNRACGLLGPSWRFSRGFLSEQEVNDLINGTLSLPQEPDDLLVVAVGPANAKSIEDFFLLGPIPKEDKDEFSAFLAASYADKKDRASVENNYYFSVDTLLKDMPADKQVRTAHFLSHHKNLGNRSYPRIFADLRLGHYSLSRTEGRAVTSFSEDLIAFFSTLKSAEKLRAYEAFEKEMSGLNAPADSRRALKDFFTTERERLKDDDPHTPALRSVLEKLIAEWS